MIYRFIVLGEYETSKAYISSFLLESMSVHQDFIFFGIIPTIIPPGVDSIIDDNESSLSSLANQPVVASTYSNQTVIYETASNYTSDIYCQVDSLSISVYENTTTQFTPDLWWSVSGSISIKYNVSEYNGGTVPSWISVNSNTGILTIISPHVSSDTNYSFYVNSVVNGYSSPIQKLVKVNVKIWSIWGVSETAKALSYTSISILTTTGIIIAVSNIMSASSMSSFWSLLNQMQSLFLLLLTRALIPDDIQTAIKGFKFALNPYQYLSLNSFRVYRLFVDKFKFGVRNNDIESFGIDSDSSIYNTSSFVIFIVIVAAIYVWIWIFNRILLNWIPRRRCSWFLKALKWIIGNIFELMTFGYFIRTFIEIFQYLLVSSINEIYWFNTSQTLHIVSLVYAILTLTICLLFVIFALYLAWSSYKIIEKEHNKLGELFSGLKPERKFKLYSWVFMIKKIIFVSFLITLSIVSSRILIGILSTLQLVYLIYVSILRPFKETKWNIIEILNEIYFIWLFGSLTYLNSESNWNSTLISIYTWFIASNNMLIFIIIISKFLFIKI